MQVKRCIWSCEFVAYGFGKPEPICLKTHFWLLGASGPERWDLVGRILTAGSALCFVTRYHTMLRSCKPCLPRCLRAQPPRVVLQVPNPMREAWKRKM